LIPLFPVGIGALPTIQQNEMKKKLLLPSGALLAVPTLASAQAVAPVDVAAVATEVAGFLPAAAAAGMVIFTIMFAIGKIKSAFRRAS
jgi:hypothetical protein